MCKWDTPVSSAKNACFREQLLAIKPTACLANIISGGNLGAVFGNQASFYSTPHTPRVQHEGNSPHQSKANSHTRNKANPVWEPVHFPGEVE